MSHVPKTLVLALSAILSIGLAGCDRAEQAAQSVTRDVERAATEHARKALQATGEAVNRGIDNAQDTTRRWLDKAERAAEDRAQNRDEGERVPEHAPRGDRERTDKGLSI